MDEKRIFIDGQECFVGAPMADGDGFGLDEGDVVVITDCTDAPRRQVIHPIGIVSTSMLETP